MARIEDEAEMEEDEDEEEEDQNATGEMETGMTSEARRKQKRQTMPYMTKCDPHLSPCFTNLRAVSSNPHLTPLPDQHECSCDGKMRALKTCLRIRLVMLETLLVMSEACIQAWKLISGSGAGRQGD
eukprot:760244-Hanusia_phi.AAC.2